MTLRKSSSTGCFLLAGAVAIGTAGAAEGVTLANSVLAMTGLARLDDAAVDGAADATTNADGSALAAVTASAVVFEAALVLHDIAPAACKN